MRWRRFGYRRRTRAPRVRMAGSERGSVTLELALALPSAILVLALCLSAVQAAAGSAGVHAAALAGARAAAIGTEADARAAVSRVAGSEATAAVRRSDGWVEVRVVLPGRWPWGAVEAHVAMPEEP